MRAIAGYFRAQIGEIAADPVLRIYGAVLAALHVLSFLSWKTSYQLEDLLPRGALAVCWPFFEHCEAWRFLGRVGIDVVLWLYLGLGIASVVLFVMRGPIATAYWVLLAVNVLKLAILLQDYRLRLNQHYMAFFVSVIFLLLPNKRRLLLFQIVLFYFWAGMLKLDGEWLSGAGLYTMPAGIPPALVPMACAYVVVLELVIVFGLFAESPWIFWTTFGQLLLFHVVSWSVVGWFYPVLMFAILSIVPLTRLSASAEQEPTLVRLLAGREPRSTAVFLLGFSVLQTLPWLFPGDTAITGEGRVFALHMFDARVVCEAKAVLHGGDGTMQTISINQALTPRLQCDPIVYLSVARGLCRILCDGRHACTRLDLKLRSRRSTESELRPVIDVSDFCRSGITYDVWHPNPWILKP